MLCDFPKGWLETCERFLDKFEKVGLPELDELLTGNEIFEARTQGVGYLDPQQAVAYGVSGPVARGSGVPFDVRVSRPYGAYKEIPVQIKTRQEGDAFARYLDARMQQPHFSNARSVRNALDRARLRQANRCFAAGDVELTLEQLVTIEPEDIRQSRVFQQKGTAA